jgi:carbon-monoxide dehydrogenase small subunit
MTQQVTIRVNGATQSFVVEPRTLLADALRSNPSIRSARVGCEHGVCGACTVLLDGEPIRSCLLFAIQASERDVETVESLEGPDGSLNDLQRRFHEYHAVQCGFCTSGILMSLTALFRGNASPTESEIRDFVQGHICRCTGYQQIMQAALAHVTRLGAQDDR